MTTNEQLPVVGLTVENIQKIEFADISPNKNMVTISGANGAGKTSLCNALRLALGDKAISKLIKKPITDGKETASVTVDLGKFIITRKWGKTGKSTLKIENTDGAVYKSGAELLKSMVGNLAFDPLEFSQMPEKEQLNVLLDLIDLDVDLNELDEQRSEAYETRTLVNRDIKRLEGQRDGIPRYIDLPNELISSADVMAEFQAATKQIEDNNKLRNSLANLQEMNNQLTAKISTLKTELSKAIELQSDTEDEILIQIDDVNGLTDPDPEAFKEKLANVEATNDKIREKQKKDKILAQIEDERLKSGQFTNEIERIDELKATTIANANMPIDGLSFNENGVIFNDIPLNQVATSEALKVGCAIVIATMNQNAGDSIPIIIIKDGSLLDENNMKVLEEIAIKNGVQFWIELVSTTGETGIFVEDGEVV